MIKENLQNIFDFLASPNPYGEKVTLVGATKMQTVETINQAISCGLTEIGENRPQEFRDKFPCVSPCKYHFFGRLQKNKVKYLIGKAYLIQSVDSVELAKEISIQSLEKGVNSQILLEVNLGEEQKGGIPLDELEKTYQEIKQFEGLTIKGLMSVLPKTQNEDETRKLCLLMRNKYDIMKQNDSNFEILSLGMSGDYKIAVSCGSNMIRVGTGIFGARPVKFKEET